MRGAMLFAAGVLVGLTVHVATAQNAGSGVVMMNHVAINVPNIPEAITHYTQKMGYREAFRVNDANGQQRNVLRLDPISARGKRVPILMQHHTYK